MVTYPSKNLYPGQYVSGFAETWNKISSRPLLSMSRRLRDEYGFSIVARKLEDFVATVDSA